MSKKNRKLKEVCTILADCVVVVENLRCVFEQQRSIIKTKMDKIKSLHCVEILNKHAGFSN